MYHTLAEQAINNYEISDPTYYSKKYGGSIDNAKDEINQQKATNTVSPIVEVSKSFLCGVASSAFTNSLASFEQQVSIVNTVLCGTMGVDVNKMMYDYLKHSYKYNISFEEYLRQYVTNETSYYAGRLVTDVAFVAIGAGQVIYSVKAIEAGIITIGGSGVIDALSGGAAIACAGALRSHW